MQSAVDICFRMFHNRQKEDKMKKEYQQLWMVEDLRTTKFNDGTEINWHKEDGFLMDNDFLAHPDNYRDYCMFHGNGPSNSYGPYFDQPCAFQFGDLSWPSWDPDFMGGVTEKFGYMYNHAAVFDTEHGGVCPEGFHIPTPGEWNNLVQRIRDELNVTYCIPEEWWYVPGIQSLWDMSAWQMMSCGETYFSTSRVCPYSVFWFLGGTYGLDFNWEHYNPSGGCDGELNEDGECIIGSTPQCVGSSRFHIARFPLP